MIALVTGGAGFIGSHLVRGLLERGHRVRALDDLSTGKESNLAGMEVELIVGDLCDPEDVARAVKGAGWVFHHAAMVSVPGSIEDPLGCYETNLHGTLTLLTAALHAGVEKVVLASSAAVYGESPDPLAEQAPKQPLTPYAASKLAMEGAARWFAGRHGLPTVSLRYFNVYGPGQRPDSPYAAVIPAFIQAMLEGRPATIYGDGRQRRDFVFVRDVVEANVLAAEASLASGEALNIGGGGSTSIAELAGILQNLFPDAPAPKLAPPREGDIHFSEAVLDYAAGSLGYRPRTGMEQGLAATVEWFRQERQETPL